ncbi:portal protein [Elizabethkingia phage TCUEAP1]|nr:portal protein [Elizabethkingia phage TCUEAP1]
MGKRNTGEAGLRATSTELFSRTITADAYSSEKIFIRDADNLYPLRIEKIINNSPTARRCAELVSKYIVGLGVEEKQNIVVNKRKNLRVNDVLKDIADSIAYQYGAYIHVDYILNTDSDTGESLQFGDIEVLDYVRMAKAKDDDDGYNGKLYMLEMEDEEFKDVQKTTPWFYPFNPNRKVIVSQMRNDCKLKGIDNPSISELLRHYRGQVMYLNLTPKYTYALPLVDSVYNDCDTEYRIGLYNNTQTRTGFLGKTIIVKQDDDSEEEDDFDEEVAEFLGAENSSHVFTVTVPKDSTIEDLDKAFIVKQLQAQFDDKLFESTIRNLRQNILLAFGGIPEPLILAGNGAMFGTSGETYLEMKKFLWEQLEGPRSAAEGVFAKLGFPIQVIPIKGLESVDVSETKGPIKDENNNPINS